jgi:EamA domain-containing membrane protein RarD
MARPNFFTKSDRPVDRPLAGIALKVSNIFLVTVLLSLIKTVEGMPTTELVFFRSLFAVGPVIIWLSIQGKLRATLHTTKPMAHFTRAVLSLFTMFMTFTAVFAVARGYYLAIYPAPICGLPIRDFTV